MWPTWTIHQINDLLDWSHLECLSPCQPSSPCNGCYLGLNFLNINRPRKEGFLFWPCDGVLLIRNFVHE